MRNKSIILLAPLVVLGMLGVRSASAQETYAVWDHTNPSEGIAKNNVRGAYPDGLSPEAPSALKRPWAVTFESNYPTTDITGPDKDKDYYYLSLPNDFDPSKSYPVWFQFSAFCASNTSIGYNTTAWNYSDQNDAIVVGMNLRAATFGDDDDHANSDSRGCGLFYGDKDPAKTGVNDPSRPIPGNVVGQDVIELASELAHVFNVEYFGASGASMGGYSTFRSLTSLPQDWVGAAVASAPAMWYRPYVDASSDAIEDTIESGFFNDKFVRVFHAENDNVVKTPEVQRLHTAAITGNGGTVPDDWELRTFTTAELSATDTNGDPLYPELYNNNGDIVGHRANGFKREDGLGFPNGEQWGQSPGYVSSNVWTLWDQLEQWELTHPEIANTLIDPSTTGWTPPSATNGRNWYLPEEIVALYVEPSLPDYNGDGQVNAADYTLWRDTLGQSVANPGDGADGDLSGVIDAGDYDEWVLHFGELVGGTSVPEPASTLLLSLGIFGLVTRRVAK